MDKRRLSHRAGRWRRRCGLAFLVAGFMLAVTFGVSAKWWFGYCSNDWVIDVGDGSLYVHEVEKNAWSMPLLGWHGGVNETWVSGAARPWTWTWWTWGERDSRFEKVGVYSVWPLSPAFLLLGAGLYLPGWRAARRAQRNQCPRCGYPLAGIAEAALCPECGGERS